MLFFCLLILALGFLFCFCFKGFGHAVLIMRLTIGYELSSARLDELLAQRVWTCLEDDCTWRVAQPDGIIQRDTNVGLLCRCNSMTTGAIGVQTLWAMPHAGMLPLPTVSCLLISNLVVVCWFCFLMCLVCGALAVQGLLLWLVRSLNDLTGAVTGALGRTSA